LDSQDLEPAIIHHTEFVKTCNGHTELKKYLCSEDVGLSVMQFRQSGLVLNPNRDLPMMSHTHDNNEALVSNPNKISHHDGVVP
jgi:hypothetical protein